MAHFDWIERAGKLFRAPRPEHFTQFDHCCECEDHDRTLLGTDIDTISIAELGNPGWDPICFTTAEGKKYYLPAFIRLSLETMKDEFYLAQFLFHLEGDGSGNEFYMSCNEAQRRYVASFLEYVIEHYSDEIEAGMCADDSLRSYQIWSGQ
jgi:hypothetical protein